MKNEGFQSPYVAPFCKAILVDIIFDEAGLIVELLVLGIPLTSIKMFKGQNVFHFERKDVPENILISIDEHCDRRVHDSLERMEASMQEARLAFKIHRVQ